MRVDVAAEFFTQNLDEAFFALTHCNLGDVEHPGYLLVFETLFKTEFHYLAIAVGQRGNRAEKGVHSFLLDEVGFDAAGLK